MLSVVLNVVEEVVDLFGEQAPRPRRTDGRAIDRLSTHCPRLFDRSPLGVRLVDMATEVER